MKRVVRVCLALLLGVLMTVNVFADAGMAQYPDYVTDYYMVVESPDGGIDFYAGASFDSTKLNTELIPNGTAFHIEGELTDAVNRIWGYTKYHGMTGYIPLDDCRMVTRSEAIRSELSIAETAAADYDYTTPVVKILYNGPGEKFGKVSGSIEIPAGTTVHVVKEAKLADGSFWGYTSYEYEGWIRLESLVNIVEEALENLVYMTDDAKAETEEDINVNGEDTVDAVVNANGESSVDNIVGEDISSVGGVDNSSVIVEEVNTGDASQTSDIDADVTESINGEGNVSGVAEVAEPTATSTPKPTATSTPKPAATSTPTPKPTATSTPTPKPTATNTPTPKPTATNTPTPDPTATNTPAPDPTATNTPTPDPTATNTPTPEATATNTPTPEATVTEEPDPTATTEPTVTMAPTKDKAEDTPAPEVTVAAEDEQAVSDNVKEAGLLQNPIVWIGGICLLLIIILLIYHFIKKNK